MLFLSFIWPLTPRGQLPETELLIRAIRELDSTILEKHLIRSLATNMATPEELAQIREMIHPDITLDKPEQCALLRGNNNPPLALLFASLTFFRSFSTLSLFLCVESPSEQPSDVSRAPFSCFSQQYRRTSLLSFLAVLLR